MRLLRVDIENFRNLTRVSIEPSVQATVAVGANGQGKTNILEAIYFLFTLKALRAKKLVELIQYGQETAVVRALFTLNGAEREFAVHIFPKSRQALVDGKKAQSLEGYFGGLSAVAFTPDDLAVVKGGPDGRRQFLDRAVFNRFPAFLSEAREYQRALQNRNRLLKEIRVREADRTELEAWNETLARLGAQVWVRRQALLAELSLKAQNVFREIGRTHSDAGFAYEAEEFSVEELQSETAARLAERLLSALERRSHSDVDRGHTTVGPHVDDLEITLGEKAARSYASQGQTRALVLAWKIAEIENLKEHLGVQPMLLLDDVSSELDPERNSFLMQYVAKSGSQVLLTTTDASLVKQGVGETARWLRVENGGLTQI